MEKDGARQLNQTKKINKLKFGWAKLSYENTNAKILLKKTTNRKKIGEKLAALSNCYSKIFLFIESTHFLYFMKLSTKLA
jgi:uncharacterized protein Veg